MVLSVLSDGAKYGYLIQKQIRDASGERVKLQAGTLYPLLHRLEEDKLIRSRWDESTGRSRKWYEITAAGKQRLQTRMNGKTTPCAWSRFWPPYNAWCRSRREWNLSFVIGYLLLVLSRDRGYFFNLKSQISKNKEQRTKNKELKLEK